jgi:hypothetical protein
MKSLITALLNEREGYLRRGLKNRVAQVDASLRAFGVEVDAKIDVEVAAAAPEVENASAVKKTKRVAR